MYKGKFVIIDTKLFLCLFHFAKNTFVSENTAECLHLHLCIFTLNDPSKIPCKCFCISSWGTEAETFCIPYFGGLNWSLFYCCTLFKCLWTRVSSKSLQCKWKKCAWKLSTHTCVTVNAPDPICVCICMCMYIYVLCVWVNPSPLAPTTPSHVSAKQTGWHENWTICVSPLLARSPNSQ